MNGQSEQTQLDSRGCCEPDMPAVSIDNPPGLPALAYRIGAHAELLRRMVARLPKWTIPDGDYAQQRPLAKLTTRSGDDPAIALLDAWALVGDVLTFYQERIANEGFLRTASQRRSVLELARAIGYELDPGVAASAYLAFTVEDAPQLPDTAVIPAGTQVQSIPMDNDELPQTFETARKFEARVAWNTLKPRSMEPQPIVFGTRELFLEGVATNLQPGDAILVVGEERTTIDAGSERWDFRLLTEVEDFPNQRYTRVALDRPLGSIEPPGPPALKQIEVFAFRQRASLFGHNAPDWVVLPEDTRRAYCNLLPRTSRETENIVDRDTCVESNDWPAPLFRIRTVKGKRVHLDRVYETIVPRSWVVLSQPSHVECYRVMDVKVESRTDFTLTAKTTRLEFDTNENLQLFKLRDTVIHAGSEQLRLAGKPIETAVGGKTIQLAGLVEGLQRDHVIIVRGKESADDDVEVSEVAVVESSTPGNDHTELELQEELARAYVRSTVTVHANVVNATHGETIAGEVLGSGNGSQSFQTFQLKRPPLTYVSSVSGSESTLTLRVDGVQWQQVPSLYAQGPGSRSYTVRINDDAQPRVTFGDGRDGARLPTGSENVLATYRSGIGTAGNVGAGTLMLLKTKPFGIRGVTNPAGASGGEDPERLSSARRNAPVTVLTLERIVSLRDYEDYARSFPGIGKARVDTVWMGEAEVVHVTIATVDGEAVEQTLFDNLFGAIAARRDPLRELQMGSFEPLLFNMNAGVLIDPSYEWESVQAAIDAALRRAFSFDEREFGQPVSAAEVIRVIHAAKGVVAVDLSELALIAGSGDTETSLATVLGAKWARFEAGRVLPAQLLLINTAGIQLTEMQP